MNIDVGNTSEISIFYKSPPRFKVKGLRPKCSIAIVITYFIHVQTKRINLPKT